MKLLALLVERNHKPAVDWAAHHSLQIQFAQSRAVPISGWDESCPNIFCGIYVNVWEHSWGHAKFSQVALEVNILMCIFLITTSVCRNQIRMVMVRMHGDLKLLTIPKAAPLIKTGSITFLTSTTNSFVLLIVRAKLFSWYHKVSSWSISCTLSHHSCWSSQQQWHSMWARWTRWTSWFGIVFGHGVINIQGVE